MNSITGSAGIQWTSVTSVVFSTYIRIVSVWHALVYSFAVGVVVAVGACANFSVCVAPSLGPSCEPLSSHHCSWSFGTLRTFLVAVVRCPVLDVLVHNDHERVYHAKASKHFGFNSSWGRGTHMLGILICQSHPGVVCCPNRHFSCR